MVGGPRRRRFFWGQGPWQPCNPRQNGPKTGPWRGLKFGPNGAGVFFGLGGCILGGACTTSFSREAVTTVTWGGPAKPGFKDCRVVRARVLDSVWGMVWDESGRVAPKLAGFQPRRHAHPVQSCQNRGHAMAVDPLQLTGKIALLLMASRGRKGECGKEEGLGTRRWFHAVRVSGS